MEYKIYRPKEPPDQLSSEQFEKLKKNKDNLLEVLYIEEKYNLILENYAEFELELFNNNLKEMLYNNLDWSSSVKKIFSTNRRIINVLTVCRLYLDQVAHNISTIYGSNSEQEKVFKKLTHQEYDSNLAYEVMDCLRNYLQHRGLLKRLHYSSSHVKVNDNTFVKHTTSMFIDISELSHDGAFKKEKTLAKLEKQGKTFEFISFLRQYVESISKIHIKLREVLKSDTENWEQFLYEAIESYNNFSKNQENFVIIDKIETKQNQQGNVESVEIVESVDIFDEFIKYRKILEDKNKRIYTSSNYISSESPKISEN